MFGWIFRSNYRPPPRPRHRTPSYLPNTGGRPKEALKFAIIREPDGTEFDAPDWDYVENGVKEGWLQKTDDHIMTTRHNQTAFGFIYYLRE